MIFKHNLLNNYNSCFVYLYFCLAGENCQFLRVKLKNNALTEHKEKQGAYQLLSSNVNGRPSWISISQAIWYIQKFKLIENLSQHACFQSLYLQWKFKLLVGKVTCNNEAKHCRCQQTVCWLHPAIFCLYTSSKLSRPYFEFSLQMKILNAGLLS